MNLSSISFFSSSREEKILPIKELGLYIHIPFCSYRCHYCNFYLETGWSSKVVKSNLENILEEFSFFYEKLQEPNIKTLYIGGGTPSIIPEDVLDWFLSSLVKRIGRMPWEEATFEMNPESLSLGKLKVLSSYGFNRISLGVQTFHEKFLLQMGRRSSLKDIEEALAILKSSWKGSFSIDLITGYPGQSEQEVFYDLRKAICFNPSHISLYDLTVEEKTPLEDLVLRGDVIPLKEEVKEEYWLKARDFLVSQNYGNYETSNFALKGYESLHNQRYWDLLPYLGIGAGAVSLLLGEKGNGEKVIFRRENSNIFDYKRREETNFEKIEPLEFLFEHFMVGWRTQEGVSKDLILKRFGKQVFEKISLFLEEEYEESILNFPARWALKQYQRDTLNSFLIQFQENLHKTFQRTKVDLITL